MARAPRAKRGCPAPRSAPARRYSAAHPGVESLHLAQQSLGRMRLLPGAGGVLVRLGERRIDMDGAEDLVEPDAVLHRRDELGKQVAGVLADDGGAEDAVLARRGGHLDEAVRDAVGDGAIEIVDAVR